MTQLTLVLPAPTVENETDGYLDPAVIPGTGVKITTPAYGGIEPGQWVGLEWTAVDPAGSLILPARRLTTAQPLEFTVPKAVAELSQDKAVSVAYTVARVENGLVKTSEAVPFELSKIKPVTPPGTEGFDNAPIGPINKNFESDKFWVIPGASIQAEIIRNPPVGLEPIISGNAVRYASQDSQSSVMIMSKEPCSAIQFGVNSGSDKVTLVVYHYSGYEKTLTVNSGRVRVGIEETPTLRISSVSVRAVANTYGYLDNISIEYDPGL